MAQSKTELAERVWAQMFNFLMATSPMRQQALARRHLTPNDARALWSLDEASGHPIGALAREWGCDPSNATLIVDRLVRAGLVFRKESPTDRRMKLVRLTEQGVTMRQDLIREYHTPPPAILSLSEQDLEQLDKVLGRLGPACG